MRKEEKTKETARDILKAALQILICCWVLDRVAFSPTCPKSWLDLLNEHTSIPSDC